MKPESISLMKLMAQAIKSRNSTPVDKAEVTLWISESLKYSGSRIEHLESDTRDKPEELKLLLYLCALPHNASLANTTLDLIWECTQVLIDKGK